MVLTHLIISRYGTNIFDYITVWWVGRVCRYPLQLKKSVEFIFQLSVFFDMLYSTYNVVLSMKFDTLKLLLVLCTAHPCFLNIYLIIQMKKDNTVSACYFFYCFQEKFYLCGGSSRGRFSFWGSGRWSALLYGGSIVILDRDSIVANLLLLYHSNLYHGPV